MVSCASLLTSHPGYLSLRLPTRIQKAQWISANRIVVVLVLLDLTLLTFGNKSESFKMENLHCFHCFYIGFFLPYLLKMYLILTLLKTEVPFSVNGV